MVAGDKLLALSLVLLLIISSAIPAVCGFSDFPESPSGGAGGVFTGEFPTGEGTQPESPFVSGFRHDSRGGGVQPVAHWIFQSAYYSGGAWQDQSGNGYHATASQAPSYDGDGNWELDGSSDYASPGDALDSVWTGASGWTVEIKLKPASGGGTWQYLLAKDGAPTGDRSFWVRLYSLKPDNWWFDGVDSSRTYAANTLSTGTTYILRMAYDPTQAVGSRVKIYLDDSDDTGLKTLSGSPVDIQDTAEHLGIGEALRASGVPSNSNPFKGAFEYLKIWDENLPP
jgi:hypothetical protein